MAESYDLVIIGGGPGGYTAALRARQLGLSVALAEKERIGGVCLNRGCIPTKALLSDMEGLRWMKAAAREGLLESVLSINFPHLMERKRAVVEKIVSNLEKHIAASGIKAFQAKARVIDPETVSIDNRTILKANNIVIATGSRPWIPPIPGADSPGVLSTREILELDKPPESLVIIGGGIIGQEFAAIFSSIGTRVKVLEALDRILTEVDSEIARKYASLLPGRGVATEVGVRIGAIERVGDRLRVVYEKGSEERTAEADLVLMATGRRPFWTGSGIEELGLDPAGGSIPVDRFLKTPLDGIYAVGDVVGRKMLAHVASYHGEIAAENCAGHERPVNDEVVPGCVFTMPQIGWVGLTEEEAKESGRPFRTSTFSLFASGKALAMGEPRGWVKLVEDAQTNRLIGAHLMGPQVSELLAGITLAIRKGMTASDIAETIHPHPTISEAVREAALGFLDGPIHATAKTRSFSEPARNA